MAEVVTSSMMSGVLSEVTGLIPVVLPAAVTYIAIRKGIAFVLGILRRA